jgi:hypothetical protein
MPPMADQPNRGGSNKAKFITVSALTSAVSCSGTAPDSDVSMVNSALFLRAVVLRCEIFALFNLVYYWSIDISNPLLAVHRFELGAREQVRRGVHRSIRHHDGSFYQDVILC